MYDQRLFNQGGGVEQGFGNEEEYDVYDKPLFADRSEVNNRNIRKMEDEELGFVRNEKDKVNDLKRKKGPEFEKYEDNDIFGMDQFIKKVKKD